MSELINPRQQEPEEVGFTEIVRLIGASRERAMQAVNTALIDLYWQIGEIISRRVAAAQIKTRPPTTVAASVCAAHTS